MGTVVNFLRDGLANFMTGRGTTVDRSMHNFWVQPAWTDQQIAAAYRSSWLHRKIVDIVSEDMTRAGRDWDAEDDQIDTIEAEERRLGYWAKLRQALTLGRLGGGLILIGLGDDPSQPLPETVSKGQIQYLTVLSRWQVSLGDMVMDPVSEMFGQPQHFMLSGQGTQIKIHPSRVVCFHGLPVPAIATSTWEDRFWGDSVVQAVDEAVQHASTASAGFASLIDEAKIDIFKFYGLVENLASPDGEARAMQRTQLTQQGKSIHRAVILDSQDEWEQRQVNWAGMRDVIVTYDGRVAGAADIPATRLFGKAPDGMNATGDGDLANYFQGIGAKQEMQLRSPMEHLDSVVLPSAGVKTALTWKFSTLMVMTEQQEAEIEAKEAETITKVAAVALIPESALAKSFQNRLIESGRWPGLGKLIEEAEAAGEELPSNEPDPNAIVDPKTGWPVEGQGVAPARRAANDARFLDATPRTLYVRRDVVNVAEINAWAKAQGIAGLADDLHVTVAYSTAPLDWIKVGEGWDSDSKGQVTIAPGGPRVVEPLGGMSAVLMFASSSLAYRNLSIREAGASWDWPDYQPHISLTKAPIDVSGVEPYRGKIVLGPEIFEEVDPNR